MQHYRDYLKVYYFLFTLIMKITAFAQGRWCDVTTFLSQSLRKRAPPSILSYENVLYHGPTCEFEMLL